MEVPCHIRIFRYTVYETLKRDEKDPRSGEREQYEIQIHEMKTLGKVPPRRVVLKSSRRKTSTRLILALNCGEEEAQERGDNHITANGVEYVPE